MEEKKFFEWLKQKGLADIINGSYHIFKKIYTECLGIKDEKVLIISDWGNPARRIAPLLAGCYYLAAKDLNIDVDIVMQNPKFVKGEANKQVVDKLARLSNKSTIILCPSGKIGSLGSIGKSFRKFAKNKKHKFLSATNLGHTKTDYFYSILDLIDVDYRLLNRVGNRIKSVLDNGKQIHVTTLAGTDLIINIDGMKAINNSGIYRNNGTGGNLPAGEVYIAPNIDGVNGKVVIDGSMRTPDKTYFLKRPVTLEVENGTVTNIYGGAGAKVLENSLQLVMKHAKYPQRIRKVCEFGIGTNPRSRFLGPTIINEKTWRTAHIAMGSNYWFGGNIKTIVHLDQVFKYPIIKVDGKVLKV